MFVIVNVIVVIVAIIIAPVTVAVAVTTGNTNIGSCALNRLSAELCCIAAGCSPVVVFRYLSHENSCR